MSALFNQNSLQDDNFDPISFVQGLNKNSKVEIPDYVDIQFPIGWQNIIKDFIESIKSYPIRLNKISDNFAVLEIKFEVLKRTREVNVWRLIDEAKNQSAFTCTNCGGDKSFRRKLNLGEMLCESCSKNAGQLGKTKTWLDKY